jgi:hypothetical protein
MPPTVVCDIAESGSESAFLFKLVCTTGLRGGFGGGESGFCAFATIGVVAPDCCGAR